MTTFRMRYLLFSIIFFYGCASDYKGLQPVEPDKNCIEHVKPKSIKTSWYTASVDVVGKHLSGLLLIKNMPDDSDRIVFMNEAGVKFFDLEFDSVNRFTVKQIIPQLNKKPVIHLLESDFRLMLAIPFRGDRFMGWKKGDTIFYGVQEKNEMHYFITDKDCASLQRIETGSKRKRKVSIDFSGMDQQQPDSVHLQHHTFAMNIALRKLIKN